MKILHIADIHWRGLSRHKEYVAAFQNLFEQAKKIKPDIIYVGGDIVHSKTQGISPELVDHLVWWFKEMEKIAPVHIILGNHDGLIHNKDRQDAITPIIDAISSNRIFLYKNSGVYPTGIPGFDWCVFSCFDEENWDKIIPSKNVSIALYHGPVRGSLTDEDWDIDGDLSISFFENFDFGLFGDIHKRQFLNQKNNFAYCGSTIQQNYGEEEEKGFLLWDIKGKNDFNVQFYPVENNYKFITVAWQGSVEDTVNECIKYPDFSRFRINSTADYITPAQSKSLQKELKKIKNASEVVFKIDNSFSSEKIKEGEETILNLRDPKTIKDLMRQYYLNNSLSDDEWKELDNITISYLSEVNQENFDLRNIKWGVNRIKFDNTFCYGEANEINLDEIPGITGIFGKNARGKSSIVGTIAYGLFNSSDRGSIKNIHIINSRKNFCKTEIDITVNGSLFRVVRETSKKSSKNNIWAPTTLNVYKIDECGSIEDMTEEQRRESEKTLRSMIGTSDDFHMTGLAAQGDMNNFIKEKATARKNILSNFLDMNIFDILNEHAKKQTSQLRTEIKQYMPETSWQNKINDLQSSMENNQLLLDKIIEEKDSLEKDIENLTKELLKNDSFDFVTLSDLEQSKEKINFINNKISNKTKALLSSKEEISTFEAKIQKIEDFISSFDIKDIKEKNNLSKDLLKTIWELQSLLEGENKELNAMEKSIKKLLEVPCGDAFPTCKFIKDSHKDKNNIEEKREKVNKLRTKANDLEEAYSKIKKENYEEKIEKYNLLIQKKSDIISNISNDRLKIQSLENEIQNLEEQLLNHQKKFNDLKIKYDNQDTNSDTSGITKLLDQKKRNLKENDFSRIQKIKLIEGNRIAIEQAKTSKEKFDSLNTLLKVQDLFIQATSKRGIPVQIIDSLLPKINRELANILKGVVDFTVLLEVDLESNAMDVYIDYGDSKRIIELGSGMEKMISSLAIRVALINISSLPKSSLLIIDEGFGSLDETNLESCGRLLHSFKKYFKNILVISHIDQIKDIVDNTIDIIKTGVDSYVQAV
jgi:DNA repair exonuclease SbcCD ATPase subunit